MCGGDWASDNKLTYSVVSQLVGCLPVWKREVISCGTEIKAQAPAEVFQLGQMAACLRVQEAAHRLALAEVCQQVRVVGCRRAQVADSQQVLAAVCLQDRVADSRRVQEAVCLLVREEAFQLARGEACLPDQLHI